MRDNLFQIFGGKMEKYERRCFTPVLSPTLSLISHNDIPPHLCDTTQIRRRATFWSLGCPTDTGRERKREKRVREAKWQISCRGRLHLRGRGEFGLRSSPEREKENKERRREAEQLCIRNNLVKLCLPLLFTCI
jgi:hypothetical protein